MIPILVGVNENISPAELKLKYPGVRMTRQFISNILPTNSDIATKLKNQCKPSWDAGLIPVVSFKTDPITTASGAYDALFQKAGTYLATAPETWVIWYHEPEDNMVGSVFAPAFGRARGVMKQYAPNLKVGYSAMAYQWGRTQHTAKEIAEGKTPPPMFDSDSWKVQADFYGCDVYSGDSQPVETTIDTHTGFLRWQKNFAQFAAQAEFGLTERGWWFGEDDDHPGIPHTDEQRAAAIRREAEALDGYDFYIYWNTPGTQNADSLVNGPMATEALKELVFMKSNSEDWQDGYEEGYLAGHNQGFDDGVNELKLNLINYLQGL